MYPEKYIFDVAGFPKIRAQELVNDLVAQMEYFNPTIVLEQEVQVLERLDDEIIKLTTDVEEHLTKTVIITAGNGAFHPRKISLKEAEQYKNKNLHYLNQFHKA